MGPCVNIFQSIGPQWTELRGYILSRDIWLNGGGYSANFKALPGKIKRYQNIGRCGIREVMSYPMPLTGDPLSRELKYNSWDFSGVVAVELKEAAANNKASPASDDAAAFVITVRTHLSTLVNFKSQSVPVDSAFFKNPTVDTNKNLLQFDFADTGRQRALDDKAAIERLVAKCI